MALLKNLLELYQALLRDEYVVVSEQVGHMEPPRHLHPYVFQVASGKLEVFRRGRAARQEAELVGAEGGDDCLEQLGFGVVELLTVDEDEPVLEQLRREHDLEALQPLLVVDRKLERARHRSVGLTAPFSLRRALVPLSCLASALLRGWFNAGAGHVSDRLHTLPHRLAPMLEILEHFVHEVASERLVEVLMVECDRLVRESPRHKAINGHAER